MKYHDVWAEKVNEVWQNDLVFKDIVDSVGTYIPLTRWQKFKRWFKNIPYRLWVWTGNRMGYYYDDDY